MPKLFLALMLLALPAAATSAPMTLADVAATRSVRAIEVAPTGDAAAWVLSVPRRPLEDDDGPAWGELWVAEGNQAARGFVTGEVSVSGVSFSRDGESIHFLAKRDGDDHTAIWSIPRRGGEARRLRAHTTAIKSFVVTPDATQVIYLAEEPVPEATKTLREQGFNQEVYEEEWQPVKVWVAKADGSGEATALTLPGSASELSISPAGDRISVALAPTSLIDDEYMARKVHVVDLASGAVVGVVATSGKLGRVGFSPDGKHLSLLAGANEHDPAVGRLLVVPVEGGEPRDLLPGYLGHVTSATWEDADTLVFVGGRGVESEIAEVDLDGTTRVRVPLGGGIWSGLSRATTGELALLGESAAYPTEAFRLAAGSKVPERLSTSNPWLAERQLARRQVVRWVARDGLDLEGVLDLPAEGKGPWPLVIVVHGGPEAHVSNGWTTRYANPSNVLAGRGFAVLHPNYRASTGRGVAFSQLDFGDPAGAEFDDLVDAIDHLVQGGVAIREKVGITGGSYGGYASAWAATALTQHFAAAVMFVGISDLVANNGTTDIPVENELVHYGFKPHERWDLLRERSPVTYAEQARTPILILHGKDDPRVHPSQSLILYRYLKLVGKVPVRLVWYPGEGHGNRRAASQLDYSIRLTEWMAHYLQGSGGAAPVPELDYRGALGLPNSPESAATE